ncbi:hypothetical protein VNO80_08585 [Phaseolus coccineus]|uniref:Uncharacterized protein n=1 Tax=Phaseolus coccineus TaxID=3886 RepID=A0AAN9RBQ2_PHACN
MVGYQKHCSSLAVVVFGRNPVPREKTALQTQSDKSSTAHYFDIDKEEGHSCIKNSGSKGDTTQWQNKRAWVARLDGGESDHSRDKEVVGGLASARAPEDRGQVNLLCGQNWKKQTMDNEGKGDLYNALVYDALTIVTPHKLCISNIPYRILDDSILSLMDAPLRKSKPLRP